MACTELSYYQCQSDNYLPKQLNFVSALNEFLAFINVHPKRSNVLEDQFKKENVENDDRPGWDLIRLLSERCHQLDLFEPVKRFKRLADSLTADNWTDQFQTLSKEICKSHLLPVTSFEEKVEGGRRIVVIKGAVIFVSQVKFRIVEFLTKAQEVQIIGLATVHVDCNLENINWHGMNVVVIADKIIITEDQPVLWDVSGRHDYFSPEQAESGTNPGDDGFAGEHGLPGESGGNVYIACNELLNAQNWTIKSNGDCGYDGQDGGNGRDGQDGEDGKESSLKRSKNDFRKLYPPLNSIFHNQSAIKNTLTSIISNVKKLSQFQTQINLDSDQYLIKGLMQDGTTLTASLWKKNAFMLFQGADGTKGQIGGRGGQGGKGGQGGYGGTITVQKLNGEPFVVDGLRIEEEIMSTAVSTGARGLSGLDGKDGAGGKCGKTGQSCTDFGYIDNMNTRISTPANGGWKKGLNYFGFDEKIQKFDVQYLELLDPELSNLDYPYTLCNLDGKDVDGKKLLRYAVFYPLEYLADDLWMTQNDKVTLQGRQKLKQEEPLKKKAITGQSLVHHLIQVAERKAANLQMVTKTLWPMQEFDNLDQNTTLVNQSTFISFFTTVDQQYKKSIDSRNITEDVGQTRNKFKNFSGKNPEFINDEEEMKLMEQIDIKGQLILQGEDLIPTVSKLFLQRMSTHLEPQPTGDEDHQHSILHAALGQKDDQSSGPGNYVFKNVNHAVREFQNGRDHLLQDRNMTRDFVLRLTCVDGKNSKYLKKFRKGLTMKNKYLEDLKDSFWQPIEEMWTELEFEIQQPENEKLASLLGHHLKNNEKVTLLLRRCLDDDDIKDLDPKACQQIREHFTDMSSGSDKNNRLKYLVEELKKKFEWTKIGSSISHEYNDFLLSETWSLSELLTLQNRQHAAYFIYEKSADNVSFWNGYQIGDKHLESIFLLHDKNKGVWQRLELDMHTHNYFKQILDQTFNFQRHYEELNSPSTLSETQGQPALQGAMSYFTKLLQLLDDIEITTISVTIRERMITSIKMFNPEYGQTPDELSRLLVKYLSTYSWNKNQEMDEHLANDIALLAEQVMDYNGRFIEPIFYLHVVANLSPCRWKYEFVLQEMEEKIKLVLLPEDRKSWRECLFKLDGQMLSLLRNKLVTAGKLDQPLLNPVNLGQTLFILAHQVDLVNEDLSRLERLPLNTWKLELRNRVWQKVIKKLSIKSESDSLVDEEKKEVVYLLLELENKKGETFCHQLLDHVFGSPTPFNNSCWLELSKQLRNNVHENNSSSEKTIISVRERDLEEIIFKMKNERGGDTSEHVAYQLDTIEAEIMAIRDKLENVERNQLFDDDVLNSLESFDSLQQIENWAKTKQSHNFNNDQELHNVDDDIRIFLFVYIRAVQLKMDIRLRNTQRVAIMTLLKASHNTLAQVPTGEGKSLIVAALAIYHALCNKKVDIITNNNVLAKRDSSLSVDKGGLLDLYQIFNIDVSHNCNEAEHDRIKAYDSAVVYGELSNFQRDYLLDQFYGRNIRGDRTFDCVIVDEVDCMLLDRGNNILYLSHDIPGMETLESLYVFIWEKIRTTKDSLQNIKSDILYDLYGTITLNDLEMVYAPLKEQPEEKETIWCHLVKIGVIDLQGRLLIESVDQIKEEILNYSRNPKLNPKLSFFFRNVFQRERRIHIPQHLLSFVDRHLDTFLDNAMRSLILSADEHYVVDHNCVDSSDRNPQVIIIDSNTGTDQAMSQWDGGLHQFLQLKEGCRLTLQSLKSVFISNVTFIKRYKNLAGLSGTLGSRPERTFLRDMYQCDFFSLPTAFPKTFSLKPAVMVKSESMWLEAILKETHQILFEDHRSLVIFCRSIKDVKLVYHQLKNKYQQSTKIHRYTRDYEQFQFGGHNELEIGHVIVATNLAGRGTDIKTSQELRANGGLHICLTYLPDNIRIEEQAMGRAGRKKDPGSGRLIILSASQDNSDETAGSEWPKDKIFDVKEERNRQELHRIAWLSEDFYTRIDKQEKCFDKFWKYFRQIENHLSNEVKDSDFRIVDIICKSVFDRWALWLDQIDENLSNTTTFFGSLHLKHLLKRLKSELINQLPKNLLEDLSWMTPDRSIALAKHYATRAPKPDLIQAASLLDKIINSKDNSFYPAAYYYRTFVHIKEHGFKKHQTSFLKLLRSTKTVFEQHIDMHHNFCITVNQQPKKVANENSFYIVEAYKEQKENVIKFFHYLLNSIQLILGIRCSVSDLEEIVFDARKAKNIFKALVDSKCVIQCQVNDRETVPDRDLVMEKVASNYGVTRPLLENFLNEKVHNRNLSEEDVLEMAEKSDMIRCTRRKFWDYLVDRQVMHVLNQKKTNFTPTLKSKKYVLFDPTPENIKNFIGKNELIEELEFGQLQIGKLKTVDLTLFGRLTNPDDLSVIISNEKERSNIWKALIDNKFINHDGKLSLEFKDGKKFNYPECPIYEHAVMSLIERTYVAELIRRRWLNEDDSIQLMKIIAYLPLEPYRDLLSDLHVDHVISGTRVTCDKNVDLKDEVKLIIKNKDEQGRVISFLQNNQPKFAKLETPKVSLVPIEQTTSNSNNKLIEQSAISELNSFRLVALTDVITLSEKKWSIKMKIRSVIILSIGVVLVLAAIAIYLQHLTGIAAIFISPFVSFLLYKGISDIWFAISSLKSGEKFSWADYRRQMFRKPGIFQEKWRVRFVSRTVNFFKRGNKTVESTFVPIDQSLSTNKTIQADENVHSNFERVVKSSYLQIDQAIAIERLNGQVESIINNSLDMEERILRAKLNEEIKRVIAEMLSSTKMGIFWNKFHRIFKISAEANRIVKKETTRITKEWAEQSQFFLCKLLDYLEMEMDKSLSNELFEHTGTSTSIAEKVNKIIKLVLEKVGVVKRLGNDMVTTGVKRFHSELETYFQERDSNVHNNVNEQLLENFIQKVQNDLIIKLEEATAESMEYLKTNICRLALKHVVAMTTKAIKKINQNRDKFYDDGLKQLEDDRCNQWTQRGLTEPTEAKQNDGHVQSCLNLMKKTNDPNLLASLIREKCVPDDPFCTSGLKKASRLIQSLYSDLDTLTLIQSSAKVANLIETDQQVYKAIRLGWRNYNKQKCPFQSFPIAGSGCIDTNCELRGLTEYPGYMQYVDEACRGPNNVESFHAMRENFLLRQDTQNAIWLNIKTYVLPVVKRLKNVNRRKEFIQAAVKHITNYSSKAVGNNGKLPITRKEAKELKKRLHLCVS